MNKIITLFFLFSLNILCQEFHMWVDSFGLNKGIIFYPQYNYKIPLRSGNISGYGFFVSTPHEKSFVNNLIVYTPNKDGLFSIHSELGGLPFHGKHLFQFGPRFNIGNIKKTNVGFQRLFVTFLPKLSGIRGNNVLMAGSTKPIIYKEYKFWIEGYRRFSKGNDYAEYWLMSSIKQQSRFSYGAIIHRNGKNSYVGFGLRLNIF